MTLEQRDIVLIPFPFSDLQSSKSRPVLVISGNNYNTMSPDFLGMAVTSNLAERVHTVLLQQENLASGHLKVDSVVRADKVYSLSRNLVRRKFGSVKSTAFLEILSQLDRVLERRANRSVVRGRD